MTREERIKLFNKTDIYPVTCEVLSEGRTNLEVLDAVLAGGAGIIQLREKHIDMKGLYELALEFKKRTERKNALLIINDHLDIALAADADGVHLGQEDLPITAARKIAPALIIGVSSHNRKEALRAEQEGADYINIGPVFPTKTKGKLNLFLGTDTIRAIAPLLKVPFTTMGGINIDNIHEVLDAGARHIAMVTGITRASDIAERINELKRIISSYSST